MADTQFRALELVILGLQEIVSQVVQLNLPPAQAITELRSRIARAAIPAAVSSTLTEYALTALQSRLLLGFDDWTAELLPTAATTSATVTRLGSDIARTVSGTVAGVENLISIARARGLSTSQTADLIRQQGLATLENNARTLARTGAVSLNQSALVDNATRRGITRWRYVGPAPDREFCSQYIGRELSLTELQGLSNDFGQPAITYRGGWNCRHRWQPVVSDE